LPLDWVCAARPASAGRLIMTGKFERDAVTLLELIVMALRYSQLALYHPGLANARPGLKKENSTAIRITGNVSRKAFLGILII
jgi:hypothetical protein